MTLAVGSLFSGIGGIDLGLEQAGMTVAWQCEIDRDARQVLAAHWPTIPCYSDVKDLNGRNASTVDVLCGGFPCQDVSVAGRRAGLAGERSGLFHEFVRLTAELAPRWLLVENVPGLLSSNDGRDMGTVLGSLADLGYGWAYRLLDAQFFGLAQRRERVFIVGCAGDPARAAEVLLEPSSCDGDPAPGRAEGSQTAGAIASRAGGGGWPDGGDGRHSQLIPATVGALTSNQTGGVRLDDQYTRQLVPVAYRKAQKAHDPDDCERWEEADVAQTLDAGGHTARTATAVSVPTDMGVRRLTPIECERLQGFPDDWARCGLSDSARYRCLGNAVAVPVAAWIGRRIVEVSR